MPEVAQVEFPAILVEYARKKLETDRVLYEYLSQFGDRMERGAAQMIIDAAGEMGKNGT